MPNYSFVRVLFHVLTYLYFSAYNIKVFFSLKAAQGIYARVCIWTLKEFLHVYLNAVEPPKSWNRILDSVCPTTAQFKCPCRICRAINSNPFGAVVFWVVQQPDTGIRFSPRYPPLLSGVCRRQQVTWSGKPGHVTMRIRSRDCWFLLLRYFWFSQQGWVRGDTLPYVIFSLAASA